MGASFFVVGTDEGPFPRYMFQTMIHLESREYVTAQQYVAFKLRVCFRGYDIVIK